MTLKKLLDKFPSDRTLDAVDDDLQSGTRPAPMMSFATIAEVRAARAELLASERIRAAVEKHRAQKADDRCVEDDDELYAALGDGIKCDRRVGDKEAMLQNCARYVQRRCEGGGWPTYIELETLLKDAREKLKVFEEYPRKN